MLYAAMTVWMLAIVLSAWGVHRIWSGLVQPKLLNSILLPGTLVAQLGHVLGLLITGATVEKTTLIKDDETGEPETTSDAKPRIPVIGPLVIALLPLLACAMGIWVATRYLGQPIIAAIPTDGVGLALPTSLAAFWETLRQLITLVENVLTAVLNANTGNWQTWLFLYLIICLTVRMAPFPGAMRGALGAIVLVGVLAAVMGTLTQAAVDTIQGGWPIVSFSMASLLFLLMVSAVVRGGVSLFKMLAHKD